MSEIVSHHSDIVQWLVQMTSKALLILRFWYSNGKWQIHKILPEQNSSGQYWTGQRSLLPTEIFRNVWREAGCQRPNKLKSQKWSLGALIAGEPHLYRAAEEICHTGEHYGENITAGWLEVPRLKPGSGFTSDVHYSSSETPLKLHSLFPNTSFLICKTAITGFFYED